MGDGRWEMGDDENKSAEEEDGFLKKLRLIWKDRLMWRCR